MTLRTQQPQTPRRHLLYPWKSPEEAARSVEDTTIQLPATVPSPTWREAEPRLETREEWQEKRQYNPRRPDSHDQAASQKNKYLVQALDGNRVYRDCIIEDRPDAVSLAYDMMQFAATSYNAIGNRQGKARLEPERMQFAEPGTPEFDRQIIVEWAVIPDDTPNYQACRVTVIAS